MYKTGKIIISRYPHRYVRDRNRDLISIRRLHIIYYDKADNMHAILSTTIPIYFVNISISAVNLVLYTVSSHVSTDNYITRFIDNTIKRAILKERLTAVESAVELTNIDSAVASRAK